MRPEIRRMILEDSRITEAFTFNMGVVWSRTWSELFDGYDHATMMEIPVDSWLRYEKDGGRTQGIVAMSRYVVYGIDDDEEEA